jgi:hypothetical protein
LPQPGQRPSVAGPPSLADQAGIQAVPPQDRALLAVGRRIIGGQDLLLVLSGERPPAGPLGHLRIRASLPLASHPSSIAGHLGTAGHGRSHLGKLSPSPPSGSQKLLKGRVPHDSLADRVRLPSGLRNSAVARQLMLEAPGAGGRPRGFQRLGAGGGMAAAWLRERERNPAPTSRGHTETDQRQEIVARGSARGSPPLTAARRRGSGRRSARWRRR